MIKSPIADAVLSGDAAMMAAALEQSQRFHDEAAEAIRINVGGPPKFKPCEVHPNLQRPFSSGDSAALRAPAYGPCPECSHEKETLAPALAAWRAQGLPSLFFDLGLDDLEFEPEERAVLEEFNRDRVGVLVLIGTAGTGKTSAACAILQSRRSGHYVPWSKAIDRLRASYTAPRGGEPGDLVKRQLLEAKMLVLDEFEKVDAGADGRRMLFQIIDGRYNEGLPTIICGNCTLDWFKTAITEPGLSRITGSGGSVLELVGRDRRPDGKARYKKKVELIQRLKKLATED